VEKIWLKNYAEGVKHEINADDNGTLVDILNHSCEKFKERPAFENLGTTITYKEFQESSIAFAGFLQKVLKLKKGDRLAIMMPNMLQYPIAVYGALLAGVVVVNVNPLYTTPELVHQVNDAGAESILVISNFANTVQKAIPETKLKNIIITDVGDLLPRPKAWLLKFVLKYIKKQIPSYSIPNEINFRDALAEGKDHTVDKVEVVLDDTAFLQYTGGTTGVSKGAVLSHRNMVSNVMQAEAWFGPMLEEGQEVMITALPLYHIFSLLANFLFFSSIGGLSVLITNPRDLPRMVSTISRFKFTVITGVNTLYLALNHNKKFCDLDFSKLKVCISGGMATQEPVATKWKEITGKPILEAYGLTETSPVAIANPIDLVEFSGTVGLPVPSTDVCIVDENHKALGVDEIGELAIKGPQVTKGYWHHPEETKKSFTEDGWFLTGDIASINEDGYVKILERKKDMILVSGFNVYPNEVEAALVSIDGISEAAVVGVLSKTSGEIVKAFVVREDENITKEKILEECKEMLTAYKIPKVIEFRDELPKTNVGKILRRALREKEA